MGCPENLPACDQRPQTPHPRRPKLPRRPELPKHLKSLNRQQLPGSWPELLCLTAPTKTALFAFTQPDPIRKPTAQPRGLVSIAQARPARWITEIVVPGAVHN